MCTQFTPSDTLREYPEQFATRGEWLAAWANRHCDAYHPSTRDECSHCHLMIEIYGPMPTPDDVWGHDRRRKASPNSIRRKNWLAIRPVVFERDGYTCVYCGATDDLAADHIYPQSKGGSDDLDNLQTLCRSCNSRKGTRA